MDAIATAFAEVANRLGFNFRAPFTVRTPGGHVVQTLGLVEGFGSEAGTLLFSESSGPTRQDEEAIRELGYYFSVLFPGYEHYDESLIKETLDDWGYYGPESQRPVWYTGKPWAWWAVSR